MQPVDPINDLGPAKTDLHLFGLHMAVDPSMMWWAIFLVFVLTQYGIAKCRPGRYQLSNMRAMMRSCPPSSASTAENSPATDHAATTANRNAPHGSTPDPRPTRHSGDSGKRTALEPGQ